MADPEWVSITGTDSDPLVGDSEIIAIRFRPEGGGLVLELQNDFRDGPRVSELRFHGVRFFQLCNEGVHYLDRVEIFERISDALNQPEVGPYLRAFSDSATWLTSTSEAPRLKVYRLMPIAGGEAFVVCLEAKMRPWRQKPE
jgi:hypothetical protein